MIQNVPHIFAWGSSVDGSVHPPPPLALPRLIHSLIQLVIPPTHTPILPPAHACMHSFISFTHSFSSFTHTLILPPAHSCMHAFIHSSIHPFIHPFIHSFIQSINQSINQSIIQLVRQPTSWSASWSVDRCKARHGTTRHGSARLG